MKIQFDPNLDFQADALSSIVALIEGEETRQANFTVGSLDDTPQLGLRESSLGLRSLKWKS